MKRRALLAQGTVLLPVALSGCLDSGNSTGDSTTKTTTKTPTSTTTMRPGSENLLLLNDDSTTHTISVAVSPNADEQNTLVDSTYEVPSQYILEFTDLLEHGTEYLFEATVSQGTSVSDTLTAKGCGGDQHSSSGDRSIVIWLQNDEPDVLYKECDVRFPSKYTRSSAAQYEVSGTMTTSSDS
ncbi:hypothetical protein [Haladaptatus sp. NG-SE-30]